MKKLYLGLALVSLLGLSGCADLLDTAPESTGNTALLNYNKASVDALIKDRETTRAQLRSMFGYPSVPSSDPTVDLYQVIVKSAFNTTVKTVSVQFNKNDVVTSHCYIDNIPQ